MTHWPLFLRAARLDGTTHATNSTEHNAVAAILMTRPWLLLMWWAAKWKQRRLTGAGRKEK